MTSEFTRKRRAKARYRIREEVVKVIQGIPEDEAVLVFTYKFRPGDTVDIPNEIRGALEDAGVDTGAMVIVDGVEKDRIVITNWGFHTADNRWSYVDNVILAGVITRSQEDLAASILGQTRDLEHDVHMTHINGIKDNEHAQCVYQALSRGAMRRVDGDHCVAMKAWVIHRTSDLSDILGPILPGAHWETWETKGGNGAGRELVTKITAYLEGVPAETGRLSRRQVKADVLDGGKAVEATTWRRAMSDALDSSTAWARGGDHWITRGRDAI